MTVHESSSESMAAGSRLLPGKCLGIVRNSLHTYHTHLFIIIITVEDVNPSGR